jgi:hypothetical protein
LRTQASIDKIISAANLMYSYEIAKNEINRTHGQPDGDFNVINEVSNILTAISTDVLSLNEKSVLCDVLVRRGYAKQSTQLMFTEDIYNSDFDKI